MSNGYSKVISGNLAFNVNNENEMPKIVVMTSNLYEPNVISIKIGDYETKISKEELSILIDFL